MRDILLTTDGLITIKNKTVVLIRRAKAPFEDKLVMPGGHVETEDESVAHACARELEEEIGLKISPEKLKLLKILDAPGRDPRPGRRISVVYWANLKEDPDLQAGDDAAKVILRSIKSLKKEEVGFDHWEVIKMLLKKG